MANKRRSTVDQPEAEGNATGANQAGQKAAQQQGADGTKNQVPNPARGQLAGDEDPGEPRPTTAGGQTSVYEDED